MLRKLSVVVATVLALLGCDAQMRDLKPGVSTASDVSAVMGKHTHEWKEPDGSVTWEFPRGPAGVVTYMVVIGKDGLLREIRQVLTDATFAKLQPGMSHDEVRKLVGRPAETMKFANLGEDVWSWKYEPATGEQWMYHVHFALADGRLKRTSRTQVGTPP
jgi:hypothetical protein